MDVEVFLTGGSVNPEDLKGRTVIVIDVLRSSSTIISALNAGARSIIPVADMAEAGKIAANLDSSSYLLGGERGALPIEGYHLGNSPFEYTPEVVEGKTIILHTTNGTGAIVRSSAGDEIIVGGMLNAAVVADRARKAGRDVTIVCAGWMNRVSLEDTLCAGLILSRLWNDGGISGSISDGAYIALTLYRNDRDDLSRPLGRCNHAQRLNAMGHSADVDYCIQVDTLPVLPVFSENRIELVQPE